MPNEPIRFQPPLVVPPAPQPLVTEQEAEEIEERGENYDELFDVPASMTEVGDDLFEPPAPMTDEDLRELTDVGGDDDGEVLGFVEPSSRYRITPRRTTRRLYGGWQPPPSVKGMR